VATSISSSKSRRTVKLPWRLTRKQTEIYRDPSRYLVLVAGRRFGKTVLAITWLVSEVVRRGPGSLGYYVAPYRVMAKAIAWDMLLKATRGLRTGKNESELTVTLRGGRRIALKGADDPETLEGVGLVAVVLDEFARMKLDAWQKSIRPALSDKQGRALICGKPRGHNHLKEFYERGQDAARNPGWRSWLYRTVDGGFVPTADVAEAKGTLPAKVYRQEYEATFESLAGRVYEEFQRRTHLVPAASVPAQFRRIVVGVDWGFTHNGVMLVVGQTATGQRYVIHEEVHAGKLVDDTGWLGLAVELVERFRPMGYVECFAADPSEPGNITALRAKLRGNPVVRNADNRVREGIRRVAIALLPKLPHGRPGLLVSDACPHTLREIEAYVYQEHRGVTTEEPAGVNDHCMDALRYAEMALPA
jgi:phage terminase large subunit